MQALDNEIIINQIITKNYAEIPVTLAGGKITAKLRTLQVGDQLQIEDAIAGMKEKSQLFILHQYSMLLLARSLIEYNDQKFTPETHELTYAFIEKLPSPVIDILVKQREEFQQAVMKMLVPEELEKSFFPVNSSDEEFNSSLKVTT